MKHIIFLEGDNELTFREYYDCFEKLGYKVDSITGLYDSIRKLSVLETKQPDTLFVSNGAELSSERREELIEQFFLQSYRPKNIIFPSKSELVKYKKPIKILHQQGVKFFIYWLKHNSFEEITP